MSENTVEIAETEISPVVAEYERWEEYGKKLAIDQALHPMVLNDIPWEKETPVKIAEFTLRTARDETLQWVDDRKSLYWAE